MVTVVKKLNELTLLSIKLFQKAKTNLYESEYYYYQSHKNYRLKNAVY